MKSKKQKVMSKSKKPSAAAVSAATAVPFEVNAFNIENPAVGQVAYDAPPLEDGRQWIQTIIDYGNVVDGVFQLTKNPITGATQGGVLITQSQWIAGTGSPINPYVNGDGRIAQIIPAGTYAVRVYHRTALSDGQNGWFNYKDYYSVIKEGFQF